MIKNAKLSRGAMRGRRFHSGTEATNAIVSMVSGKPKQKGNLFKSKGGKNSK